MSEISEIRTYPAWALTQANGAVPDLTNIDQEPIKPKASTGKRDPSVKIDISKVSATARLPEVVIYEHIDFGGVSERTNLNWFYVGDFWNDKISSIIVVSGTWRFYEDWHYENRFWELTPGYYRWVVDVGIPNDLISSFQVTKF